MTGSYILKMSWKLTKSSTLSILNKNYRLKQEAVIKQKKNTQREKFSRICGWNWTIYIFVPFTKSKTNVVLTLR